MEGRMGRTVGLLAVGLVAALAFGGWQWWQREQAETMLAAQYQRAFYELLSQVENTEVLLAKSLVAASPGQQVIHLTDIWRQAFGAQANLNQLPLTDISLLRTSRFLTQAGDYAYALARRAARGESVTPEQWEQLEQLKRQAGLVARQLQSVIEESRRGQLTWQEVRRLANRRLARGENRFRDGFERLELQLTEFPTLIYDGPFSDHIERRDPRGVTGSMVSREEAVRIAREFVPLRDPARVQVTGEVEGPIPAFAVRVEREGGGPAVELHVSRRGGHVVWMLDGRGAGEPALSLEQAVDRAREFLAQRGMGGFAPTWATAAQGRAVIPFVLVEDGVRIYPDLVKVTVALDDGAVLGYEALGFLMSHHQRQLPRPRLSEAEARERVHPALRTDGGRLALIPLETLEEVLTWEFPGELDGDPYVVYINALTGAEEQILKLLPTGEGTLAL
ncbi:MAG TPA: germination protein YpeB [Limnochordales bacterium]|nr:germination protein YpeB [Limnochordales bacterium]